MRTHDRYLRTIALGFTVTTGALALFNVHQVDTYFAMYTLEYVAITWIFVRDQRVGWGLFRWTSCALFAGFLAFVVKRVMEVLLSPEVG